MLSTTVKSPLELPLRPSLSSSTLVHPTSGFLLLNAPSSPLLASSTTDTTLRSPPLIRRTVLPSPSNTDLVVLLVTGLKIPSLLVVSPLLALPSVRLPLSTVSPSLLLSSMVSSVWLSPLSPLTTSPLSSRSYTKKVPSQMVLSPST